MATPPVHAVPVRAVLADYLHGDAMTKKIPKSLWSRQPRIPAAEANRVGLVCKYGHAGRWRDFGPYKGKHVQRTCGACGVDGQRFRRYGITREQYSQKAQQAENRCAMCGTVSEVLCVDHNHETGQVRGLICDYCNRYLGFVEKTPQVVEQAGRYLGSLNDKQVGFDCSRVGIARWQRTGLEYSC